jgi:hypothetical protein
MLFFEAMEFLHEHANYPVPLLQSTKTWEFKILAKRTDFAFLPYNIQDFDRGSPTKS